MGWLLRRVLRILKLLLLSPLRGLRALIGLFVTPELLVVSLRDEVPDYPSASKLQKLLSKRPPHLSAWEARVALDEVARDPRGLRGVLIVLDQAQLAWIQAEALIGAIQRVQEAGLKVLVWGDALMGPGLAVAAQGDRALGASQGTLGFLGVRVRNLFLAEFFAQVGVVPLMHRHGDYKTMADMFMRERMSEAHREMSEELASDLYSQITDPVAKGRGLSLEATRAALDDAPVAHVTAVEKGLLDGEAFRDEVLEKAAELAGVEDPQKVVRASVEGMLARRRGRRWRASILRDLPRVRVIELRGGIVDGEQGRGCPATLCCEALEDAREDDAVKAVVLRIDSPGGSVTASERMWRSIKRLDEEKPVISSMGRVAASGGYYAAVATRTIVAHPGTLTGSIGVVSGKIHLAPALRRAGITFDSVQVGARAGILDPDRGFAPEESEAVLRELMRYYENFVARVAEGRRMERDAVDALAQGRVYTGRIAHKHQLVDRLGGLDLAIRIAKEEANVGDAEVLVEHRRVKDERMPFLGAVSLPPQLGALEELLALAQAPALAYCPLQVLGI